MEMYDYECTSVPKDHKKSFINISVVTTGLAVAMSTLYTGAALAPGVTLYEAIFAVIAGCIVLGIIMVLTGTIGVKTGYATAYNSRSCLGIKGSKILSLVMATPLIGWFAFQASFFGQTVNLIFPDNMLFSPNIAAVWGGLLMTSTAVFGFRGLAILSYIAMPFLYIYSIWGVYLSGSQETISAIAALAPTSSMSIGAAITIVIGSYAVGAVNQSDISRYCKSAKENILATVVAMSGFALAIIAGFIMIVSTQTSNVMEATLVLGMGSFSLVFVMLLQWTSNDSNLYASALAVCNIKPLKKWKVSLVMGIISSIVAGLGLYGYFDAFLSILGTFIPPMAGILAVDFYIMNKDNQSNKYVENSLISDYNIAGLISFALTGSLTYILSKSGVNLGVDAVFSIVVAGLMYFFLSKALGVASTDNEQNA